MVDADSKSIVKILLTHQDFKIYIVSNPPKWHYASPIPPAMA